MRYGLNAWFKDQGEKASKLREDLISSDMNDKMKLITSLQDELLKQTDKIAGFIGDIFDYQRELVFDEKKAFPMSRNEKHQIEDDKDKKQAILEAKIENKFPSGSHKWQAQSLEDTDTVRIERQNLNILVQILIRHEAVITFAFPNMINHLKTRNCYKKVIDSFLKVSVLQDQKWEGYLDPLSNKYLSFESLRSKIMENREVTPKIGHQK